MSELKEEKTVRQRAEVEANRVCATVRRFFKHASQSKLTNNTMKRQDLDHHIVGQFVDRAESKEEKPSMERMKKSISRRMKACYIFRDSIVHYEDQVLEFILSKTPEFDTDINKQLDGMSAEEIEQLFGCMKDKTQLTELQEYMPHLRNKYFQARDIWILRLHARRCADTMSTHSHDHVIDQIEGQEESKEGWPSMETMKERIFIVMRCCFDNDYSYLYRDQDEVRNDINEFCLSKIAEFEADVNKELDGMSVEEIERLFGCIKKSRDVPRLAEQQSYMPALQKHMPHLHNKYIHARNIWILRLHAQSWFDREFLEDMEFHHDLNAGFLEDLEGILETLSDTSLERNPHVHKLKARYLDMFQRKHFRKSARLANDV